LLTHCRNLRCDIGYTETYEKCLHSIDHWSQLCLLDLAAEHGVPIGPNLVDQLRMACGVVAHKLRDQPIGAHLERSLGLEDLVDSPMDHLELDVAHPGCCDGIHVIVLRRNLASELRENSGR